MSKLRWYFYVVLVSIAAILSIKVVVAILLLAIFVELTDINRKLTSQESTEKKV